MRSTKHRVGILVLAFLLCFGCLAGCGRDSGKKEENKTVTATPTATATPTPTPTPEPWKSYEKAGTDNVYRVPVAELADGATVTEGSVGGEYVLLQTYKPGEDIPGPEWGELLLLRPAFSGETASFNPGYPVHKIRVIPDGTVFLVESVSETVHVCDSAFREVAAIVPEGARPAVIDFTEDGHMWICNTEAGILRYADRSGKDEKTFDIGKGRYLYQHMGGSNGKEYFRGMEPDEFSSDVVICADSTSGAATVVTENLYNIGVGEINPYLIVAGDMFYHSASDTWFLHDYSQDGRWITFPKHYRYEDVSFHDGDLLCVRGYLLGKFETDYTRSEPGGSRVYDIKTRTILGELTSQEITECDRFNILGMRNRTCAVARANLTNDTQELLLWDLSGESTAPLAGFFDLTKQTPEECFAELCKTYGEAYGISYTPNGQKTGETVSDISVMQRIDLMNRVARGVADNPAEFPKDEKGIAIYLENNQGHERGHAEFKRHICSRMNTEYYGEAKEQALFNLIDAMYAGEDSFECADRGAYAWGTGRFTTWFWPVAVQCIEADFDSGNQECWKDGRGYIKYTRPIEEVQKIIKDFEETVCGILDESVSDDYTDFEKALGLYEYITQHWTYDYELYSHIDDPSWWSRGNLYRCTTERLGICWEIAGVYNYLLGQLGVETEEQEGWNTNSKESHAWTIIMLDGKPYHIDATWGLANGGMTPLAYFLFTDAKRADRDYFPIDAFTMVGTDEVNRKTRPEYSATDTRYEALWNGRYIGMDRVNKNVIYLDEFNVLHAFCYEPANAQ